MYFIVYVTFLPCQFLFGYCLKVHFVLKVKKVSFLRVYVTNSKLMSVLNCILFWRCDVLC